MTDPPDARVAIVDTNVFSYIFKGTPEAAPYLDDLRGTIPAVTFVTVAELYQGAYKANWGAEKLETLDRQLRLYLVLPYDESVAQQWARIQTATPGRTYPVNDAWTAACALSYGCPLLTHNLKHFEDIPGLRTITHV